jgi:hypothetical protein
MTEDKIELEILKKYVKQHEVASIADPQMQNKCARELDMREVLQDLLGYEGPLLKYYADLWLQRLAPSMPNSPKGLLRRCSNSHINRSTHVYHARAYIDPLQKITTPAWERIRELESKISQQIPETPRGQVDQKFKIPYGKSQPQKQGIEEQRRLKGSYEYDVFICHASEDKDYFVRPLAQKLREEGSNVWYDEFTLKVGDSLRRKIDQGLLKSRFGIVVLSPNFFKKDWPQKELDGLTALEVDGRKVILPIWHKIDQTDVKKYSPMLSDRVAVRSLLGIEYVVTELLKVIKPRDKYGTLLSDVMQRWLIHGILPSVDELYIIRERINPSELTIKELAFIYCAYHSKDEQLESWVESGEPIFSFNDLTDYLARNANYNESILSRYPIIGRGTGQYGSRWEDVKSIIFHELTVQDSEKDIFALYCFLQDHQDRGLEILVMRRDDFKTLVQYIPKDTETEKDKIIMKLLPPKT